MKGIANCEECAYYSMKKHKCTRGCKDETDCPLPDVQPVMRERWVEADFLIRSRELLPNCGADMRKKVET